MMKSDIKFYLYNRNIKKIPSQISEIEKTIAKGLKLIREFTKNNTRRNSSL